LLTGIEVSGENAYETKISESLPVMS